MVVAPYDLLIGVLKVLEEAGVKIDYIEGQA
jgi:predicted acylesterase/phospholipase RssA